MRAARPTGRTMTGTEFMPGGVPEGCVAPLGDAGARHQRMMLRRWRVFAGIFMVYLGYALPDLWQHHAWPGRIFGFVLLLAFCGLYLGPLPLAAFERRPGWSGRVFAGMTAIPLVYLVTLGGGGIAMAR